MCVDYHSKCKQTQTDMTEKKHKFKDLSKQKIQCSEEVDSRKRLVQSRDQQKFWAGVKTGVSFADSSRGKDLLILLSWSHNQITKGSPM